MLLELPALLHPPSKSAKSNGDESNAKDEEDEDADAGDKTLEEEADEAEHEDELQVVGAGFAADKPGVAGKSGAREDGLLLLLLMLLEMVCCAVHSLPGESSPMPDSTAGKAEEDTAAVEPRALAVPEEGWEGGAVTAMPMGEEETEVRVAVAVECERCEGAAERFAVL